MALYCPGPIVVDIVTWSVADVTFTSRGPGLRWLCDDRDRARCLVPSGEGHSATSEPTTSPCPAGAHVVPLAARCGDRCPGTYRGQQGWRFALDLAPGAWLIIVACQMTKRNCSRSASSRRAPG